MKMYGAMLLKITLGGFIALLTSVPGFAAPLNLSTVPLYLTSRADPNVLLNMSVETPMGGAAYNDQSGIPTGCAGRVDNVLGDTTADNIGTCYFAATAYLGYFDPNKCYTYDTSNTRFNPAGATGANHTCTGQWSGNFLNWATMTAVDMFVMTMTGGNRVVDTTTDTVIQRARKQNNNGWYPRKVLNSTVNVAPSTVTPYSNTTIFIHNTSWGFDLGTTFASATGGTPDIGTFQARVKVCDSTVGLESNCTSYGTAPVYYKPQGLIQQHAAQKRFAVMSYTNDNTQQRWGGVLRAPMKYVGPTMPDGSGGTVSNTNREWGTDGILIANPDSATSWSQSGVVNYINKFSEASAGYKSFDPIGELFYESIRYFKNLGPTAEAYSGITLDSTDSRTGGFPIYTSWTDPIQYSCQKNFIVAINDANPWLDKQLPGTAFASATITGAGGTTYTLTANDYGEPSTPDTSINVTTLTNQVGTYEGLNSTGTWINSGTWTSGSQTGTRDSVGGGTGTFNNSCDDKSGSAMNLGEIMGTCPFPGKQNSYYIAGLAWYANTTDLRSMSGTQKVSSFFIDSQEYASNPLDGPRNMLWLAGKYGGFIDSDGNGWPNLAAEWDSDGNGRPDNYVLATEPQNLVTGLSNAFIDIDERSSTAAAVALNSSTINSGTRIYQAKFSTSYWNGDLIAWPVNADGSINTTDAWMASDTGNIPAWNSREIITRRGTVGTGTRGVAFTWPSSPSSPAVDEINSTQVNDLKAGGVTDAIGQARLEYLRGSTSGEGATYRNRGGFKMGDVINSAPVHVGKPKYLPDSLAANTGDELHSDFREDNANRTSVVYVGANDGMLHAFNATTGAEMMAYVPYSVFPNLYKLTQTSYAHQYYVDGQLTTADVHGALPNCSTDCWRTILVGGLGGGGKGIFALDVTDPSLFSDQDNADQISLWEFNDTDLGYTYGQPVIAKMHDDTWRAIFGNGYNSTNEKAVLYLVNIVDPTDVTTIVLDSTLNAGNGLSSPAVVDTDGDYVADYIFAGDLKGNMWKVDVTGNSTSSWASYYRTGSTPKPLFKAENPSGTAQPITSRPEIGNHPVAGTGGYMVYFGTGQYMQESDKTNTATQNFYGVWDKNSGGTVSSGNPAAVSRTRLVPQTISTATVASVTVRQITNYPITGWNDSGTACSTTGGNCMGWRVDLPTSGERIVTDSVLVASGVPPRILFTTMIPSNVPCSYGGTSWIMELAPTNGGTLTGAIFDVNGDGVLDSNDLIGGTTTPAGMSNSGILTTPRILHGGSQSTPGQLHKYFGSTEGDGTISHVLNPSGQSPSRQSWRQLR